jgi:MOSC domain-containing protein YiiM
MSEMAYEESSARVVGVSRNPRHDVTKLAQSAIRLRVGYGVEGDAHAGVTVQHRSRVRRDPTQPNLRQVHLISGELLDELCRRGFHLGPGQLGENITTRYLDNLSLPRATRLHIGASAVLEVTGLRNPCIQLERLQAGLMAAVLERDHDNRLVRKAGIMAVVVAGGDVVPGDGIAVERPVGVPHDPLLTV